MIEFVCNFMKFRTVIKYYIFQQSTEEDLSSYFESIEDICRKNSIKIGKRLFIEKKKEIYKDVSSANILIKNISLS